MAMNELTRIKKEISSMQTEMNLIARDMTMRRATDPEEADKKKAWRESKARINDITRQIDALTDRMNVLYLDELENTGGKAAIYSDAAALTADTLDYMFHTMNTYIQATEKDIPEDGHLVIGINYQGIDRFSAEFPQTVAKQRTDGFNPETTCTRFDEKSMKLFFNDLLSDHLERLKGSPEEKALKKLIRNTLKSSPYIEHTEKKSTAYSSILLNGRGTLPIYHGQAFDNMAKVTRKKMIFDPAREKLAYGKKDDPFFMEISDISKLKSNISVRTHALLSVALCVFTAENNRLPKPKKGIQPEYHDYTVRFLADDYIRIMGYDITEKIMNTLEEQAAEHKRASREKYEARRDIKNDLDLLHSIYIDVKHGRNRYRFTVTPSTGIEGDYIYIKFNSDIIGYLAALPKTQYPLWLPRISGRNSNSYRIGNAMMNHYAKRNNHRQDENYSGNYNRLKVKSLLSYTDLPTVEELKEVRYSGDVGNDARKWRERIKARFEDALNNLVQLENGGLNSWHYERTGIGEISQEDVDKIKSFDEYSDLVIVFDPVNPPDFEELGKVIRSEPIKEKQS